MIQSVEKQYSTYENKANEFVSYELTYENGEVLSVPLNEENRHYQEILEWVAEGNTITDNGGAE